MKKNGIFSALSNSNGNNNIGALLNMLTNNKNSDKTKSDSTEKTKNEKTNDDFPSVPLGYQYAKLIEKHDALSKKIDLQNKIEKK